MKPNENLKRLLEAKDKFNEFCDQVEGTLKKNPDMILNDIQMGDDNIYVILESTRKCITHSYDIEMEWPKFHGE